MDGSRKPSRESWESHTISEALVLGGCQSYDVEDFELDLKNLRELGRL
ncbi:MAG: hypothetical protein RSE13_01895 [Planktothrix sp. GU0601_MAG3]|nr:MAG: hypothetical protein RSE13_01895 [Planktothrix sp. GU0601_MAG3]